MSYEKIAMADSAAVIPTQPLVQMREDREIDPYRHAATQRLTKASQAVADKQAGNGQPAIISEDKPIGSGEGTQRPDGTTVPEVKSTEETLRLSPQVAALAQKEQRFRQREAEMKKRTDALEAERTELAELRAMKEKLAKKDYSGLDNLIKYDEYTQYLLDKDAQLTPEQQAVKALSEEVAGLKTAKIEETKKQFEAAVNQRRNAVKALIEKPEPEFSRIKRANAEEQVVKHILDTWEHDGVDLSPEQASKEVSAVLLEQAKKWKAFLDGEEQASAEVVTAPPEEAGAAKQLPPLKPQVKTLTNNMAATGEIKRPVKSMQFMTQEERYMEARRRAEEKLKLQTPR